MTPAEQPPPGDAGPLTRIRARRAAMPEALRRVADQVLAAPHITARLTLVELAERSGTSAGTITRFCREAGFTGYADLRVSLAASQGHQERDWHAEVAPHLQEDSPLEEIAATIAADASASVSHALRTVEGRAVDRCARALAGAGRIDLVGVGGSHLVASELQLRLHRLGRPSWSWGDAHSALSSASLLGPGDVLIAVSGRGRSVECHDVAREAGSRGALVVGLTGALDSPLARIVDVVLQTRPGPGGLRAGSRLHYAQMAVVDLLYLSVVQQLASSADAALERTSEAIAPRFAPSPPER